MKIVTSTRDYNFAIGGLLIREFKKNHSYIMSEILMEDIVSVGGKTLFTAVRDLDSGLYKKYNGENLDGKNILIWRTGGMGDLCFITPYLKKIKELYPTSKIIFGCGVQYSDVLSKHQYVDEFCHIPIDVEYMKNSDFHLMFEGIIENNPDASSKNAYDLFGEYFCITLQDHEKVPNLTVEKENLDYFKEYEKKFISRPNPIKIGIHLKTSSVVRDVHIDVWKKLLKAIIRYVPEAAIYIIGSQDDEELAGQLVITSDFTGAIFPFYRICRGFRDSVAAISEMDLMVGGDSSGLHIAAAFQKPMVGLFGPFKSELRLKYYQNAVGIDSNIKCSPCYLHGNQPCDNSNMTGTSFCMMIFEVEKIIDEILFLLHINKKVPIGALTPKSATLALAFYKEYFANKENKQENK